MQTLKIVPDTVDTSPVSPVIDTKAGGTQDKLDCMLTYLRSLEREAEKFHGDNDDWRYGRYLLHRVMIDALQRTDS